MWMGRWGGGIRIGEVQLYEPPGQAQDDRPRTSPFPSLHSYEYPGQAHSSASRGAEANQRRSRPPPPPSPGPQTQLRAVWSRCLFPYVPHGKRAALCLGAQIPHGKHAAALSSAAPSETLARGDEEPHLWQRRARQCPWSICPPSRQRSPTAAAAAGIQRADTLLLKARCALRRPNRHQTCRHRAASVHPCIWSSQTAEPAHKSHLMRRTA